MPKRQRQPSPRVRLLLRAPRMSFRLTSRPLAGKRPPRKKDDLPKPTQAMQARDVPLELDKNLNKTIVIDASAGSGQKQPGFYCDLCKRTCKDSARYLDHLNGRTRALPPFVARVS